MMKKAAKALVLMVLLAGSVVLFLAAFSEPKGERYGMVIGLKPEKVAYYKQLHAAAWPGVLNKIKECNIRNYSIYLKEVEPGRIYLFSYFEYTGNDFAADMARMAAGPLTQKWWKETDPCQYAVPLHGDKEWWSRLAEVFHTD
jgi:L-rhamnose mutarotase